MPAADCCSGAIERVSAEALDGKLDEGHVGANSLVINHINYLSRQKRVALEQAFGEGAPWSLDRAGRQADGQCQAGETAGQFDNRGTAAFR